METMQSLKADGCEKETSCYLVCGRKLFLVGKEWKMKTSR
ncbi:hypothetical protein COPCOM_01182 [Coprococcus comes ATCC 27758]|uniref:Uncharacterized protein n=1 Tax=Coprococcus comes ATCC 27758 TaxID=470146 RepID=C0B7Q9_9FIRM|nr:hypothetical protein COPCOM_01182 [Coprococcus comes ATCC 27758]